MDSPVLSLDDDLNQLKFDDLEDQLIIGLDFGTTYSGIAYCFYNPNEKPEVVSITDWPGASQFYL
jgi:hypothetical protein